MTREIQSAAVAALSDFLADPKNIGEFELQIARLWVENGRELDGPLGDIYDIVTDWDQKQTFAEVIASLQRLARDLS